MLQTLHGVAGAILIFAVAIAISRSKAKKELQQQQLIALLTSQNKAVSTE